jgi:magnesium transporter
VHIGQKRVENVRITLIDYDKSHFEEKEIKTIEECVPFKETATVTWINIDGLHKVEIIEKLGTQFDLHPLLQEDIVNTEQRPKIEDFGTYVFVVLRMLDYGDAAKTISAEQISLVIGPNFVISFQERQGDVFDQIRDRLRNDKGRIRKLGPDYLAYSLMDAVIDRYFIILEKIGEEIEEIEEKMVPDPTLETLRDIHALKQEMIFLRKSVWPLREVINILVRGESALVKPATIVYLRDLYDHTIQVIETIETFRDMLAGMLDIYLSSVSNKMNEVMKMLTIIATIFIPLTFVAGIYGMNFRYMPELDWRLGYPTVLTCMLLIVATMVLYFRRKRWL